MSGSWRVLDLTSANGIIDVGRGSIVITTEGQQDIVPAADIAVLLLGTGMTFTSGVLHRLSEHDVVMMMCDWRGMPQSVMHPWSEHSRIAARQIAQAKFPAEQRAELGAEIVRAKLHGQAATLSGVKPRFGSRMERIAEDVLVGDSTNVEGMGARYYWTHLWGKSFVRNYDGRDRINSLLNYGYGILRGFGVQAVLAAGLVPSLGIWHSHRENAYNLVADLMEPFRPAIDDAIVHLPPYSSLSKVETKKLLARVLQQPFTDSGMSIISEFSALARGYGAVVQGNREHLEIPVWNGGEHHQRGK